MNRKHDDELRGLLLEVARKDVKAFERLFRRFSSGVQAYAWTMVKNSAMAEDIKVMTMQQVWLCAGRFEGRSAASTWVIGIARKIALMELRKEEKYRDQEDLDDHADQLESNEPGPLENVAGSQMRALLEQCIEKLNTTQRECVFLCLVQGWLPAEVAELQDRPLGTIKSRLHYGVLAVARCVRSGGR